MKETNVVIKAIRDMNLPKFIADDVILFDNMFIDLFPDCDEPENDNDELQIAIEEAMLEKKLQLNENLIVKTIQLYDSQSTRHSNMLVGKSMAGKSSAWKVLQMALNNLNKQEKANNTPDDKRKAKLPIQIDVVNPKSISEEELYGAFDDQNPPQWQDGVFSTVLKRIVDIEDVQSWMILDGPVDTLWVESLNSVMDDSKLLTLTNGDRIKLSDNMNLLFEVENLAVASPATVSRAGMIYLDIEELGWEPYVKAWITHKDVDDEFKDFLNYLAFEKYLPRVLKQKRSMCTELAPSSESGCVINMCQLFDAL